MNKIYKVVWSKVRNCYVVVSELAKRNGKCKTAKTDSLNTRKRLTDLLSVNTPALTKAVMAMLLAGMIGMPGVSEAADQIKIGYYDTNSATNPLSSPGTVTGNDAIGIGTNLEIIAQNAIGIGKNVTVGAKNKAGTDVVAGDNAIGIGTNVIARGNSSIASGFGAKANGMNSIALGKNAQALTDDNDGKTENRSRAIAIGADAQALGNRSIAIGDSAKVDEKRGFSTAIGAFAAVEHQYSTAVGSYATARANNSAAFGRNTLASGERALAMGNYSQATGKYAIAIGSATQSDDYSSAPYASEEDSIAIGRLTQSTASGTIAIGKESHATGINAVAVGPLAWAMGDNAVGIGSDARARTTGAVAIGKEAGLVVFEYDDTQTTITPATDLFNGASSVAIGNGAKNFAYGFSAETADQTYANTYNSVSIGSKTHTHAAYAVAIGPNSDATGARALALGSSDTSLNNTANSTPHTGARAAGQGSIVIGDQAKALSDNIEKNYNEAVEDAAHAYDRATDYRVNDAIAIGTKTEARASNSIAIGGNLSYTYEATREATTSDPTTKYYQTIYGKGSDGRSSGAITGDAADASIAIGGASGTIDRTNKTITVTHNPAGAFGKRAIAIGTGSLVESKTEHELLNTLLNSDDYRNAMSAYNTAKNNYTQGLMDYNNARVALQKTPVPIAPTIPSVDRPTSEPGEGASQDEWDAYFTAKALWDQYDIDKADYDALAIEYNATKDAYDDAKNKLFGNNGYAQKLTEATTAYETQMNKKREYEAADAAGLVDAIAFGTAAQARAKDSIAFGSNAIVQEGAINSLAIGTNTQTGTGSVSSVAIGNDANTGKYSTQSIAIGYKAMTKSSDTAADAVADGIAIGSNTGVFGTTGIAIGSNSQVAGLYSGAIGSEAQGGETLITNAVSGDFSYAIGNGNKVGKQETESILRKEGLADTAENKITAVKRDRTTAHTFVLGSRNVVAGSGDTDFVDVYGYGNQVDKLKHGTVIGEYNTVNIKLADTDTINDDSQNVLVIGTHYNLQNIKNSLLIGGNVTEEAPVKNLEDMLVYGLDATVADGTKSSIGIGKSVTLKADNAIAIGTGARVEGANSISIGTGNIVKGAKSGAFGDPTEIDASVEGSYAIGNDSHITTSDTFILGNNVKNTYENSVFLGSNSGYIPAGDTTAGVNGYGTKDAPVEINGKPYQFAGATPAGVVSVGTNVDGGERRIQNVAAGLISETSTDAINGSQLYAAMQALSVQVIGDTTPTKSTTVTKTTAGGEGTGTTGTGATGTDTPATETSPTSITLTPATTYEVKASTTTIDNTNGRSESGNLTIVEEKIEPDNPKSYKYTIDLAKDIEVDSVTAGDTVINNDGMTVGDTAITKDGVKANKFTAGNTTINNDGLTIAGGSSPVNLTNAGLKVGGTTVNDNGVTIQNGPGMTKDGIDAGGKKITNVAKGEADTDAVNVGQMKDYAAASSQAINDLGDQISRTDSRSRKGIAGAAALAALHPMDFDPDDKLTFAAGVGNFRGETAAAIGAFYRPDEKVMFSIGGTFGNGENLVNAGVSFSLDRRPRVTGSRTAMAKEIVELREQVAQLTALVHQIAGNQGQALPMPPAMFPNTPENKWAYDYIESLQKQGVLSGYAGRELTRNEMAAALDRALASGAKLDERITREFAPELSRIRVVYVNGQVDGEPRTFERPRSSVHEYK